MKYTKEELLKMYEQIAEGRTFVVQMKDAVNKGYIRTAIHAEYGQEAVGIGILNALTDKDYYCGTHRSQCTYMNLFDKYQFICELFTRKAGVRRGVTFDAHINDLSKRIVVQDGLIGSQGPIYTGFAWALKQRGKGEAILIEMGDGACSEGASYEAWGMAALYQVPALYVIVNNQWAMSVHSPDETFNPDISEKAKAIGLKTVIVDGNDLLAVREAVEKGLELARQNIPNVVELKTLRWGPHLIGQREYVRPDAEKLATAMVNDDPLKRYENFLIVNGYADEKWCEDVKAKVEKEISELIERAGAEPYAEFDDIFSKDFVYATPETGGEL